MAEGIAKLLQWLDEEMAHLKKAIQDHIDNDPTLREKYRPLKSGMPFQPARHGA